MKVNHLARIHPFARRASQSAKRRRAAKTNARRSPGRLFFKGHLHSSRLTARRERALSQPPSSGIQNATDGRSSVLSQSTPRTDITEVLGEKRWRPPQPPPNPQPHPIASGDVFHPSMAALHLEMIKLQHRQGEKALKATTGSIFTVFGMTLPQASSEPEPRGQ